jgi:hypothetical protein
MPSYMIRRIDPDLWAEIRDRADRNGIALRDLFNQFMRAYSDNRLIMAVDLENGDIAAIGEPPMVTH